MRTLLPVQEMRISVLHTLYPSIWIPFSSNMDISIPQYDAKVRGLLWWKYEKYSLFNSSRNDYDFQCVHRGYFCGGHNEGYFLIVLISWKWLSSTFSKFFDSANPVVISPKIYFFPEIQAISETKRVGSNQIPYMFCQQCKIQINYSEIWGEIS